MENIGLSVIMALCILSCLAAILIALAALLDKLADKIGYKKLVGHIFEQCIPRKLAICISIPFAVISGVIAIYCFLKIS